MSPLARIRQVAACLVLVSVTGLGLATPPTPPDPSPASQTPRGPNAAAALQPASPVQLAAGKSAEIGHSALLSLVGTATADGLQLTIRRVSDNSLISRDDVTVAVDGKSQTVTHNKDGANEVPIADLRADGAHDLDVTVPHDGIREIVSGKLSFAEAASAGSLLGDHKQIAWWVLNIVIILLVVTGISRRKG
jgi:hypothetical protein